MIETERLLLRPSAIEDFQPIKEIYTDPEVIKHIGVGQPASAQDSWFRLLRLIGHWTVFGYGFFTVVEKVSGRFAGLAGFAHFHRELGDDFDPFAESGWTFATWAHGKGYATEAATAAHQWFEANHGRQRTVCIIDHDNDPSIRVAKKLGYDLVGPRPYRDESILVFARTP
ncbi:MAG: GNAT family N-acetyltransferase [Rhizobiaceae bacterium]